MGRELKTLNVAYFHLLHLAVNANPKLSKSSAIVQASIFFCSFHLHYINHKYVLRFEYHKIFHAMLLLKFLNGIIYCILFKFKDLYIAHS